MLTQDARRPRRPQTRQGGGRIVWLAAGLALVVAVACEGSGAHVTAPRGADAFGRFAMIGGGFAMGMQSAGIVSPSQATSWPALVAAGAGAAFRQPLLRAPGCTAPLVAPLILGRRLSGSLISVVDSACAGTVLAGTPPGDNLAIAGATAWDALYLTPKIVAAAPTTHSAAQRILYPAVLALTQSQVTAALVKTPTFVAIELGLAEVMRAATTGHVVAGAAYEDSTAWTLMSADAFKAAFDAIADSVTKSGAKVAIMSVPPITTFAAFRPASAVWSAEATLGTFGVSVSSDCANSTNLVNVAGLVPAKVQLAIGNGIPEPLSCADIPGAADSVLTASDVAAIEATVGAMNAHLAQVAAARGWAFVDMAGTFERMRTDAGAYAPSAQLTCASPYGAFFSLDGVHPTAAGSRLVADAFASAVNATYGFALPIAGDAFDIRVALCQ